MTKVEALEQEVQKLSYSELVDFHKWFEEYAADLWDRQIEKDIQTGKLDELAQEALAEHQAGRTKRM